MASKALTSVFTKLAMRLRATAAHIVGDTAAAEDVVQDVFCRLWCGKVNGKSDDEIERITFTAVRNGSIDWLRRKQVRSEVPLLQDDNCEYEEPYDEDDYNHTFQRVTQLIARHLTPRDSEILRMREMQEMEIEEIARHFSMSEANVRVALSRSRRKIKELYFNQYEK